MANFECPYCGAEDNMVIDRTAKSLAGDFLEYCHCQACHKTSFVKYKRYQPKKQKPVGFDWGKS